MLSAYLHCGMTRRLMSRCRSGLTWWLRCGLVRWFGWWLWWGDTSRLIGRSWCRLKWRLAWRKPARLRWRMWTRLARRSRSRLISRLISGFACRLVWRKMRRLCGGNTTRLHWWLRRWKARRLHCRQRGGLPKEIKWGWKRRRRSIKKEQIHSMAERIVEVALKSNASYFANTHSHT